MALDPVSNLEPTTHLARLVNAEHGLYGSCWPFVFFVARFSSFVVKEIISGFVWLAPYIMHCSLPSVVVFFLPPSRVRFSFFVDASFRFSLFSPPSKSEWESV